MPVTPTGTSAGLKSRRIGVATMRRGDALAHGMEAFTSIMFTCRVWVRPPGKSTTVMLASRTGFKAGLTPRRSGAAVTRTKAVPSTTVMEIAQTGPRTSNHGAATTFRKAAKARRCPSSAAKRLARCTARPRRARVECTGLEGRSSEARPMLVLWPTARFRWSVTCAGRAPYKKSGVICMSQHPLPSIVMQHSTTSSGHGRPRKSIGAAP
mmetsp:Transcript_42829/g.100018  ORF Transcript_42829/g.100018 Transcript_42829/m.100018 type:complete len:210 (-) Transcript_42829:348-977(-)